MHFHPGQSKLVRCARGTVLDVVVDLRRGSPTFGEREAVELDAARHLQLYFPDGVAHGCVLSDVADLTYKVSTYYDPQAESGFRYDDPEVGIDWPDGG
jgi:dTDP-4-dehydrorhamnose 3,5-epimerase